MVKDEEQRARSDASIQRTPHTQDSHGQILTMAFRLKSSNPSPPNKYGSYETVKARLWPLLMWKPQKL